MSLHELAQKRYSVRTYSECPVEREKLAAILDVAAMAPTACNLQSQRILVVDDPALNEKVRQCSPCQFGAPVTMVICYDQDVCFTFPSGESMGVYDASIVASHIQLAAVEQGLGTCWVASFNRDKLKELLKIPASFVPVAILPMGYPADDSQPAAKHFSHLPASAFCAWNEFGK